MQKEKRENINLILNTKDFEEGFNKYNNKYIIIHEFKYIFKRTDKAVFERFRYVEKTCTASSKKKRMQYNKFNIIIKRQHSHNKISLETVKISKYHSELKI